ncbi:hypothetical protein COV17_04360 [Candidatus Woesearchaeota archaeon CG10_big_fil_rev_8_21_14_0_10_36_11]|nr:MAG: hypothetical protein COV17_04360 [Candidatus Woesearchaeota archaeon CG10_big_fil_rev_8_21_14_0_10_36_11]
MVFDNVSGDPEECEGQYPSLNYILETACQKNPCGLTKVQVESNRLFFGGLEVTAKVGLRQGVIYEGSPSGRKKIKVLSGTIDLMVEGCEVPVTLHADGSTRNVPSGKQYSIKGIGSTNLVRETCKYKY